MKHALPHLVLGIESSCDETSAAVVRDGAHVASCIVSSQIPVHRKYGGVVPELASRAHLEAVLPIVDLALEKAGVTLDDIDGIAVTSGPGLVGALMVGVHAAKAISWAANKPIVGVHHVAAHAASVALTDERAPEAPTLEWPHLALAVSGGHTAIYRVDAPGELFTVGQTLDDAAGEAFDKVATLLGLGYPGGKVIDDLAATGDPEAIAFPRAWLGARRHSFSFSGLKTSVRNYVQKHGHPEGQALNDLCASFQEAIVHVLVKKTLRAAKDLGVRDVVLCGGVAANSRLRAVFAQKAERQRLRVHAVPLRYCGDNAAMIAALGAHRLALGERADLTLDANAGLAIPTA